MKKRRKARNKKVLAFISVCFLLFLCFLCFQQPPTDNTNRTLSATIVDHLSFRDETKNETFIETATDILKNGGYTVDYYKGEEVKVSLYKELPEHGYDLIVFRVHSALMHGEGPPVGLFTSEPVSDIRYIYEQLTGQLLAGGFKDDETIYFTITPSFIRMNGRYDNTIIIMMGCDGLTYNSMAEVFVEKGAKAYISWNGPISADHTDQATTQLLKHLVTEKQTIKQAVTETMKEVGPDPVYESALLHYPLEVGKIY